MTQALLADKMLSQVDLHLNVDKMSGLVTMLDFKLLHSTMGTHQHPYCIQTFSNSAKFTAVHLLFHSPITKNEESVPPIRQSNEMAAWKGYLYFLEFCASRVHCIKVNKECE